MSKQERKSIKEINSKLKKKEKLSEEERGMMFEYLSKQRLKISIASLVLSISALIYVLIGGVVWQRKNVSVWKNLNLNFHK